MAFGLRPREDKPTDGRIFIERSFPSELLRPDTPVGLDMPSRQSPTADSQLSSTHVKMKAIPQKPGPHGSRVVKKRTSYPRLGDGLANLLAKNGPAANYTRTPAIDHEPPVCGGDGTDNLAPAGDPDALAPAVVSSQSTAILPEKEDTELITGFAPILEPSRLGHAKFNAGLETHVSENSASISHGFTIEQRTDNAARHVTASTEVSIESPTDVGHTMYDSSFTSSDDTPPDCGSATSGDGVLLSSPNSTPCTPYEDHDEHFIGSPAKKGNDRVQSINAPLFEPAVDHVGQHRPTRAFIHQPSTHYTSPKDELYTVNAGTPTTSFHCLTMDLGNEQVTVQCPASNTHEKPLHMTLDDDTAKLVKIEARLLDSYEKGEITLPQAKHIAKRNHLWILFAILEERENRSAAAFGMPTLSQCTEKMDEATRRQANPVGLGQNIVPVSIFNPYTEWSYLKQLPIHQTPVFSSAEEIKIADFIRKLNAHSFRGTSTTVQRPAHIFVDMSNIFIGFCDSWKISRGIPVQQFIKAPAFNFKVFASIMQRGRIVTKRILAGSVAGVANERAKWPRHLLEASETGYEMNIFNRVQKPSPGKSKRRGRTPPQGGSMYNTVELGITSGDESPEDVGSQKAATKNGEQGVDENLHLNMMNSMLDCMGEPATMVLATGDAAQAEFSGGFMQYATRALDRGWNLELITWKKTISSSWTASAFLERYRRQFRIIYLDAFLDELNADLLPCLTQGFESQWV